MDGARAGVGLFVSYFYFLFFVLFTLLGRVFLFTVRRLVPVCMWVGVGWDFGLCQDTYMY